MTLQQLTLFPLKSGGGIELREGKVEARGLRHDRRWMLVDEAGRFLSQREMPQLATLRPHLCNDRLILRCGDAELDVPLHPHEGERVRVEIWRDSIEALHLGDLADEWLRDVLGLDARLVWMPDDARRPVDPAYALPDDVTSFADGFPFLVLSAASVADLNNRITSGGGQPIGADRFRANFLIEGATPYAEDNWARFRIGECEFEAVKPCSRCLIPTLDQTTGERTGPEPLRTLATYRARGGKIALAQNALARRLGTVRVGDEVEVLSWR